MAMPALLYAGTRDGVFAQAEKSARAMPNCTFVALAGLDHSDAFYKAATRLVPEVLGFLRRLET
jgi:pimeloyl-ACP methyl ester carboxylesterase